VSRKHTEKFLIIQNSQSLTPVFRRNMKDFGSIPFAARGTVISCSAEDPEVVDVLFDEPFPSGTNLGGRCSIMRGASVPVKYLLNISTVCAPAILNVSVKLEKPTPMSPAHFAAAHDSVILATDVPAVTKGSQSKLLAKPQVQETLRPVSASSATNRTSSSPRVLSIAPAAPPLSVTANIPIVNTAVAGGGAHSAKPAPGSPSLSSDLLSILNSGKQNSTNLAASVSATSSKGAVATSKSAANVAVASSKSSISNGNGAVSDHAPSVVPSPDLLAIMKSGSKTSSSKQNASVAHSTAPSVASSASAPDDSFVSSGPATTVPAQVSPQFPLNYGMMMSMHPMYMGMMPPMPLPHPASFATSVPVATPAPRPVAPSKVHNYFLCFFL
jgi:hypothetical protein